MSARPQVVVVGSVMQDLIFSGEELPAAGQTVIARMTRGQGGKGSNQAIACGRTGVPTLFVGATGRDSFADAVKEYYRRARIGCRLIRKPGVTSGTAIVMLDRRGQNQIVIEPGANARFRPSDVPAALLAEARVVVTQMECDPATTAHALKVARRAGATTVLNPAPMRPDLDPALLRHVDVLIPNESEFVALVQAVLPVRRFDEPALHKLTPPALHALCRRFGVPTVIVTMGAKGSFVSQSDHYTVLPAYRGLKVVDTTGAGDAFCGGFAAGLVRHHGNVLQAARLGTAVAALSITKPGAAAAMPTRAELRRFLARNRTPRRGGFSRARAAAK